MEEDENKKGLKKFILGIGIPGSGKTTKLKAFSEKNEYVYICPDDIRLELTGNATDQTRNSQVFTEAHERIKESLENGKTVVFDATSVKKDGRTRVINFAKQNGAEKIQGIIMDTPLEIAKERNSLRERVVPEYVLERAESLFRNQYPRLTDGFDSIFTLNEDGELKRVVKTEEDTGELRVKTFNTPLR